MPPRAIIWDFDGTLAYRPGKWGSALLAALEESPGGADIDFRKLKPHLGTGFPWHHPERPHPELSEPPNWWRHVEGVLAQALGAAGYDPDAAGAIARTAGEKFRDPASFIVFEDTAPVLERLSAAGWHHLILSNHVPELEAIVEALGLARHFEAVLSSANIGYEKPHPEAFGLALQSAGHPKTAWMVGDNPVGDVEGAEAVGLPAILARASAPQASRCATDLWGVARLIEEEGPAGR